MNVESLREFLSNPWVLVIWGSTVIIALSLLVQDLRQRNAHIPSLMKAVWLLTILYSGLLGLWVYRFSGRKEIPRDSLWRQGFRSVAHCYSGCGAGEVTGVFIAAGLLSLNNIAVAAITFSLAYVFGYAMTFGPLIQAGVPVKRALIDTFYSDTATIAVMEVTAISLDLWLAGSATMGEVLFWNSLILSLTVGLLTSYPVNVLLVRLGIKKGMGDPRDTSSEGHAHAH